ncbi:MAG: S-layer homology domain-containing protein [Actinobacteria bacterium]|nr:S-layer homology domain-containing protein [Actinomycetota bacterium]
MYDRGGGATAASSQTYASYHDWVTSSGLRQPVAIGDTFDLCGTVTFNVVSVGIDGTAAGGVSVSDENDRSVCLKISYGQFDVASCGDANARIEDVVADEIGQVEVVKVSHHGSSTSSSPTYVTTLAPQVAVFTVGANSYGHPSTTVIDRWENGGAALFRTGNADGTAADGDITITGHTDGSFTVTGDTGRTYTSEGSAPATPAAQSIEPACADTTTGRFPDIDGVTHERSIECIGWWGVTAGNRDGTYAPAGTVTRDQMASFVARAIDLTGGTLPTSPPNAFTDDNGNAHELRINQLADLGVIGGVGGGRYNPSGTVNRAQMATFLAQAWEARTGTPLPAGADYFADDNGNTHEANINRVAAAGLTGGTGAGYNPGGPVTRAQMATFLSRFMAKLVADGHTDYPPANPQPLPQDEEPEPQPAPDPEPGCVDINSADIEELQRIIHIGPDRAQEIVTLRPFGSVEDLDRVDGIGPARLQDILDEGVACVS